MLFSKINNIDCLSLHSGIFSKENYLYDAKNILNSNLTPDALENYKISPQNLKKSMGFRVRKKSDTHSRNPGHSSLKRQHHIYLSIPKPSTIQAHHGCLIVIEKTKEKNSVC